jgi:hypothetical protein
VVHEHLQFDLFDYLVLHLLFAHLLQVDQF